MIIGSSGTLALAFDQKDERVQMSYVLGGPLVERFVFMLSEQRIKNTVQTKYCNLRSQTVVYVHVQCMYVTLKHMIFTYRVNNHV